MNVDQSDLMLDPYFQSQLVADEQGVVGRVCKVHRDQITISTMIEEIEIALGADFRSGDVAVGDWVTFETEQRVLLRILDRQSMLSRKAAGTQSVQQLIASNVDTLFIVTSCNADFNVARLERYLTLAASDDITPVIVLTKADLVDDVEDYKSEAEKLSPIVTVVVVNALEPKTLDQLSAWLSNGKTGVLVGSSGVGKSTILNVLTDAGSLTQGIREGDAKGRHTTTSRALKRTRFGGWLIDTPGIRQLALVNGAYAIDKVFAEISELLGQCRYSDCVHEVEPGCAIRSALENGLINADRLERWHKLHRENLDDAETPQEARARRKGSGRRSK